MPKVYAFDVDETLEVSAGPILIADLLTLRRQGHVIGLCGNVHAFCTRVANWWEIISFTLNLDTGPYLGGLIPKDIWLRMFRETSWPAAEEYILVGNVLGVSGASDDQGGAQRAGWRFIKEDDFARGVR